MTEEIEALIRKAEKYLHSAEVLRNIGDLDSAASRLYYVMFYCAEALLASKGLAFSSHRAVLSAFAQHFVQPGLLPAALHAWLREAFDKRQIGDYVARSNLEPGEL
ncbi:MAG: HEPN domain-containing protein, partial [Acidobacteriota bacterium]